MIDKEREIHNKIRRDILNRYSYIGAKVGHVLPYNWLQLVYIPSLNPREQEAVPSVLRDMVSSGLIDDTLALTEVGFNEIY